MVRILILSLIVLLSPIFFLWSCQSSVNSDSNTTSSILLSDFANILNLHGVPDSATDRTVFAFTDLGAWHGYALPTKQSKKLLGSFIGPYLLTQDNGIWASKSISKLTLTEKRNNSNIDFNQVQLLESASYPNSLKQVLQFENPKLEVVSELQFVSNRSAMIKLTISNLNKEQKQSLVLNWHNDGLSTEISYQNHPQGVSINFGKNENIGWISTDRVINYDLTLKNGSYDLKSESIEIDPNGIFETFIIQSFCFTELEREKEKQIINQIQNQKTDSFLKNNKRWSANIQKIADHLRPEFKTKEHLDIAVKCLQTLNTNWRSAAGAFDYDGLFPSYNYEWFNGFWSWDSWKHAVAIAKYDTELAQDQIRAMYQFQDEMGMIADCVYRDNLIEENNWRDTKPPLSAWAIWEVFQYSQDTEFLKELFPKIEKYHDWWYKYRDINSNGICEYGSTDGTLKAAKWESGMDNAVRFDEVKMIKNTTVGGSMNCESVDLNTFLYVEKKHLANIARSIGQSNKAEDYLSEAIGLQEKIQERFYNKELGWYFDYSLEKEAHIEIFGSEGWIPLWANLASHQQALEMKIKLLDTSMFCTYVPFPTLAASHPKFTPKNGYWRGPVWLDQAYFAIKGLENYGFDKEAMMFTHRLFNHLEGLKNSDLPIRENYHPHTGEGLESNHFSWSAAHLLLLLTED